MYVIRIIHVHRLFDYLLSFVFVIFVHIVKLRNVDYKNDTGISSLVFPRTCVLDLIITYF